MKLNNSSLFYTHYLFTCFRRQCSPTDLSRPLTSICPNRNTYKGRPSKKKKNQI